LRPLVVASQVEEAEVLVLECELPIEKEPYAMYTPADGRGRGVGLDIGVSLVISSTPSAARRNAGKQDRNRWLETVSENGGIRVGYIRNIS